MARDLITLPKAQLHLHLTGAMRPKTLRELAEARGLPVPEHDGSEVREWAAFQTRYDAARALIRMPGDIRRVLVDAATDDAADGCRWLEIQVDPTSYAPRLGGLREALEAVLTAAKAAPIPVGVIVASSWARSPAYAERLARLAVEYAGDGVVGFGLSNDERRGDVADFAPAFRIATAAGLLATPHVYTPASHVRDCVELLGAGRIGHGTAAATDPATLELLAERQVGLEICPTSYPPLGVHRIDSIPVRQLLAAGVPVALASDDPLLFGVGLAGQYAIGRESLTLSDDELATIAAHSIRSSRAPASLQRRLLAGVEDWRRAPDHP